jgi:hypothetical protein
MRSFLSLAFAIDTGGYDQRCVSLVILTPEPLAVKPRMPIGTDDELLANVINENGPHDAVNEQATAKDRIGVHASIVQLRVALGKRKRSCVSPGRADTD